MMELVIPWMAKSAKRLVTYSCTPIAHQLEADDDGGGVHPIGPHETNMVSFRTGVDFSAGIRGRQAGQQGTKQDLCMVAWRLPAGPCFPWLGRLGI